MDLSDMDEGGFDESKEDDEQPVSMEVDNDEELPPAPKPQGRHVVEVEMDRSRVRTGGQYAKTTKVAEKRVVAPPTDVKKSDFSSSLRSAGADDVLSNAEVAILLAKYGDPNTTGTEVQKQSTSVFDATFEYVQRFSTTKHPERKPEYVAACEKIWKHFGLVLKKRMVKRWSTIWNPLKLQPCAI